MQFCSEEYFWLRKKKVFVAVVAVVLVVVVVVVVVVAVIVAVVILVVARLSLWFTQPMSKISGTRCRPDFEPVCGNLK